MKKISIMQTGFPLLLISFTFLAMWILGAISLVLAPFVRNLVLPLETSRHIYLLLIYLFSLFLPAVGLLLFMNKIRRSSSRWYLGIPLFIAVFLITFLRDSMAMAPFYGISFIPAYDSLHILDSQAGKTFISIFFSLSSLLFTLSVPENKRKIMVTPFRISIFASASIIIYNLVDFLSRSYISANQIFGILHVLGIFFLGLSLVWVAVNYDKE
jgi:hypothetical protein